LRVLAIDGATNWCGLALWDARPVAAHRFASHMDLSKRLVPSIRRILDDEAWTVRDLEGIAVTLGPGSFTGLRIGVATAKTLAQVLGIPIAGVGTMDAIAARYDGSGAAVWTTLACRRDHWYLARTDRPEDGVRIVTTGDLRAEVEASPEPVLLLGDAVLREAVTANIREAPLTAHRPDVLETARLGATLLENGRSTPVMDLVPRYVGRSAAEEGRTGPSVRTNT
jgi:tRNA threonylcarbamoyladenosine biosynthesis protein TsaB